MGNFFAELKRRHIIRVAAAYAVIAWLLLQLVNNVAPVLDLPVWVARSLLLLLVTGFPVALIFAWTLDLKLSDGAPARPATTKMDFVLATGLVALIGILAYQQFSPLGPGPFESLQQVGNASAPGILIAAAAVAVAGIGTTVFFVRRSRTRPKASVVASAAPPTPSLGPPDKPSIAVLAFQNMSGDVEQEYFADGIAEEIITALSKSRWLFVIARNSSFSYKGKAADVRQIGRELGVRYVLEGSVRKTGNRVRISAQLIDAADGRHVWAERYDRALEDIFSIQDEMTHNIAGAIAPGIVATEMQRSLTRDATELDTWERLMRAHWHIWRFTREDCEEAIRLLDDLVSREPNNALVLTDLAHVWLFAAAFGWGKESRPGAMRLGGQYARRAVAVDEQESIAQTVLGLAETFSEGRHDDAIRRVKRAVELDPNSAFAYGSLGIIYDFNGDSESAIRCLQQAMRLSPRDVLTVVWQVNVAWTYAIVDDYERAAENAKRALECNPDFPENYTVLAIACAHLGRIAEARRALTELVRLQPGLTLRDDRLKRPFSRPEDRERWLSGLRKAGLPE